MPSCNFTVFSVTFTDITCKTKQVSLHKQRHNAFFYCITQVIFYISPLFGSTPQSHAVDKSHLSAEGCYCCPHSEPKKSNKAFIKHRQTYRWVHFSSFWHFSNLAEFGLVKRRLIVSGHHDDSTLVAVLPQRFGTNQCGRACKSHVDSQHVL